MNTLIYQYYRTPEKVTKHYVQTEKDYHNLSMKSFSAYSKKIGADYKMLDGKLPKNLPPFFGIFQPFFEGWVFEYDKICFVDSDILATITSNNIFEETPDDRLSAYFMKTQNRMKNLSSRNSKFEFWKDKGHINSGVVVIPKSEYVSLNKYLENINDIFDTNDTVYTSLGNFDQAFINYYVRHVDRYYDLPESYNYHLTRLDHSKRFQQNFIHYHRNNKVLMFEDIKRDIILK